MPLQKGATDLLERTYERSYITLAKRRRRNSLLGKRTSLLRGRRNCWKASRDTGGRRSMDTATFLKSIQRCTRDIRDFMKNLRKKYGIMIQRRLGLKVRLRISAKPKRNCTMPRIHMQRSWECTALETYGSKRLWRSSKQA